MKIVNVLVALLISCAVTLAAEEIALPQAEVNRHIELAEDGNFYSMLELIGHYGNTKNYEQAIHWCEEARDFALKAAETIDFEKAQELGKENKNPRQASTTKESFIKETNDFFNSRIEKFTKLQASNQGMDLTR